MRELLLDIFIKYKMDLVLARPVHGYESIYPTFNGTVYHKSVKNFKTSYENPKYPVHVVCVASGSGGKLNRFNFDFIRIVQIFL